MSRSQRFYYLLAGMLLCSISQADTLLSWSEDIQLLALNGKSVVAQESAPDHQLSLHDGKNQLLVRYETIIVRSGDEEELEQSHPFVLSFEASGTPLVLSATEVKTSSAMQRFNQQGDWTLTRSNGRAHPYTHAALIKEGFQLARDYEAELLAFNNSGHPAALPLASTLAVYADSPTDAATPGTASLPGQMLIYWYQQASPETREAFRRWLVHGN